MLYGTTGMATIWLCVWLMLAPAAGPKFLNTSTARTEGFAAVQRRHPVPVGREEQAQMLLVHLVDPDTVRRVIDHDLVPTVSVNGLLKAEGEVRVLLVVTQHGIEVLDDAETPLA